MAKDLGVAPMVLALVLAPVATELPEKLNSFLWVRDGKDALALGNITGAMVFQSTIPAAVALVGTRWDLPVEALVAGGLALAGGALALWSFSTRHRINRVAIAGWGSAYLAFVAVMPFVH